MGPVDRRLYCGTCGNRVLLCNGHIGHICLAAPVYHVGYLELVMKTLRCVCYWCARLLLATDGGGGNAKLAHVLEQHPRGGKHRLGAMLALLKTRRTCPHCLGAQPQYRRLKRRPLDIECDWSAAQFANEQERACAARGLFARVHDETTDAAAPSSSGGGTLRGSLLAREALNILQHVSDADYTLLGFVPARSHPAWYILTVMVVPPPIIRPAISEAEGSRTRGQDDLTHKLRDIVNASNAIEAYYDRLAAQQGLADKQQLDYAQVRVPEELLAALQFHVAVRLSSPCTYDSH